MQLLTDVEAMPLEDPSVEWPEQLSPYVTVATLRTEPQSAWNEDPARVVDDLAFSPWHGLQAHRPLGAINRVRLGAYEMSASFRGAVKWLSNVRASQTNRSGRMTGARELWLWPIQTSHNQSRNLLPIACSIPTKSAQTIAATVAQLRTRRVRFWNNDGSGFIGGSGSMRQPV